MLLKSSDVGKPSRVIHVESTLILGDANVGENSPKMVMCMRMFELDQCINVRDRIQSIN